MYSRLFAFEGAYGLVGPEFDGSFVSNEYPLFDVDVDRADPRFIAAYLRRRRVWDELAARATGMGDRRRRVQPDQFLSHEIPLPPLPEQRRVVARIEEVAGLVGEAKVAAAAAAAGAAALMAAARRALVGSEPDATWVPLTSFVEDLENGESPQCESRPATAEEWGVLKVGAVSFGAFDERQNKAVLPGYRVEPRYEVRDGDFLISRANTTELVGACAAVTACRPRLLLSDKIFRFRFKSKSENVIPWLDEVLKSPALRVQIERSASGTSPTMKNISKTKLLELLVPDHQDRQREELVRHTRSLRESMAEAVGLRSRSSAALDALLPAVLDRAFRSEL